MARQYSVAVRTGKRNSHETTVGTAPKIRILTGSKPANCAAAETGSLLCEITLPSDWLTSSAGASTKVGTWSAAATGAGTAGYYRMVDSAGTTCHEQGSITATGGGGDMTLDNTSIASGQTVTVTGYDITEGNA